VPKVVDAQAQRRQIRRAAQHVFSRRGVSGTGLTHVAEAVGMGRSSLYHYYPDKRSLVRDLVRDLLADEEELFRAAAEAPGRPLERIEALMTSLLALFEDWTSLGRLLSELRLRDASLFRPFFRRVRRILARLVVEGQGAGEIDARLEPELVAATLIGAIDGLLVQHAVDAGAFRDRDALRETVILSVRKALRP
jgi:AcrR family transcriptional regulator